MTWLVNASSYAVTRGEKCMQSLQLEEEIASIGERVLIWKKICHNTLLSHSMRKSANSLFAQQRFNIFNDSIIFGGTYTVSTQVIFKIMEFLHRVKMALF